MLTSRQASSLVDDLGMKVQDTSAAEELEWMTKSKSDLRRLPNEELKRICRQYGRPYSNKKKEDLISTVQLGPSAEASITEVEKY